MVVRKVFCLFYGRPGLMNRPGHPPLQSRGNMNPVSFSQECLNANEEGAKVFVLFTSEQWMNFLKKALSLKENGIEEAIVIFKPGHGEDDFGEDVIDFECSSAPLLECPEGEGYFGKITMRGVNNDEYFQNG